MNRNALVLFALLASLATYAAAGHASQKAAPQRVAVVAPTPSCMTVPDNALTGHGAVVIPGGVLHY